MWVQMSSADQQLSVVTLLLCCTYLGYSTGMADPVGLPEIADRLGVQHNTALMWRKRGLLPDHEYTVGGGPAWEWRTIERWARKTGREKKEAEN